MYPILVQGNRLLLVGYREGKKRLNPIPSLTLKSTFECILLPTPNALILLPLPINTFLPGGDPYPIIHIARVIGNAIGRPVIRGSEVQSSPPGGTTPTSLDSHTVRPASQTKNPYPIRARFQLYLWH